MLGGYASLTATGTLTRRYHGLLVAALRNPLGIGHAITGGPFSFREISRRCICSLPLRKVDRRGAELVAHAAGGSQISGQPLISPRMAARATGRI
ncbi:MAG TPA: glycogen debranching enzyme N-terminal domain-containing protein, partial [Bryobacteraceae bacterium]|nr:glycogen debranching enzyme N-terminal domain-containing protein [Bryobacteraceae bacterium]